MVRPVSGDVRTPAERGADAATTRAHNLGIVMRMLRDRGPVARRDVERDAGLAPATVLNLVEDLETRGLVTQETEPHTRARGRPRMMIVPADDRCLVLAVRVERARVTCELHTSTGRLLSSDRQDLALGWALTGELAPLLVARLGEAMATAAELEAVLVSCVVTVPGPVSTDNRVADSPQFGWGHLDLVRLMRDAGAPREIPITLVNDSSAAALAEYAALPAPRPSVMLYLEGGAAIGGGVVSRGRILGGGRGFAGELGHVTVDWRGRPCACGAAGCLTAYVGPEALAASARLTETYEHAGPAAAMDELRTRLGREEKRAIDVAIRAGDILGAALRSVYDVVNPTHIVLGGYLGSLARWIEPGIQMQLAPRTGALAPVELSLGLLGPRAGLVGAARHGFAGFFDDPTVVPHL
ncbi:ROK family protein [Demequina pelophila]|uniref:ROK family protein n=1 Tax=Demequina pelophila TaxID=1638984 RepID=UPI000AB33000|nr:ROK family protein [Demequina pelophila]